MECVFNDIFVFMSLVITYIVIPLSTVRSQKVNEAEEAHEEEDSKKVI